MRIVSLSFDLLQDLTQRRCNVRHAEQKALKKEHGTIFTDFELGFDKVCTAV